MPETKRTTTGAWIHYQDTATLISLHVEEVEARRAAMDSHQPTADVVHIRWNETLPEAIARRDNPPKTTPASTPAAKKTPRSPKPVDATFQDAV